MKRLWVDWNEVYDDDHVWTSLRQMGAVLVPEVGETVELCDADGDMCWGVVEQVRGPIIHARLKWDTWRSAPVVSLHLPAVVIGEGTGE